MVEKQVDGERMAIRLEYRFDRLLAEKLAHAYELLVSERRGISESSHGHYQEGLNDENVRYLHARFLR